MDRNEIRRAVAIGQPKALAFERANLKAPLFGKRLELMIEGQKRTMLWYQAEEENAPVLFYIHGGGFCGGLVEHGDQICNLLCSQYGFSVFSLDYPLSPGYEYPQITQWLYETIKGLAEQREKFPFDRTRMVVGGISAGANLAAALTFLALERKDFDFALQVLDCPFLDLCGLISPDSRYSGEYALSSADLGNMIACYTSAEHVKEKYCSPVMARCDELRGLPPAVILTGEWDSLSADGELYCKMLDDAGVKTAYYCFPGVIHAFTQDTTEAAATGRKWLADKIKYMLEHEKTE